MTDKAKLEGIKKLADAMYYAAFNLTTDASLSRKAMNEYHQFIVHEYHKEEPVSEDLKEAAQKYADLRMSNYGIAFYAFMSGAKWQKEKDDEEKVLTYKHGFEDCKEQMIAKAIDAQCFGFQGAALFSFRLPASNYLVGSEVKVIVIKED